MVGGGALGVALVLSVFALQASALGGGELFAATALQCPPPGCGATDPSKIKLPPEPIYTQGVARVPPKKEDKALEPERHRVCARNVPNVRGLLHSKCCAGLNCPLANGVCCEGGSHCCPSGTVCVQGDAATPPGCMHIMDEISRQLASLGGALNNVPGGGVGCAVGRPGCAGGPVSGLPYVPPPSVSEGHGPIGKPSLEAKTAVLLPGADSHTATVEAPPKVPVGTDTSKGLPAKSSKLPTAVNPIDAAPRPYLEKPGPLVYIDDLDKCPPPGLCSSRGSGSGNDDGNNNAPVRRVVYEDAMAPQARNAYAQYRVYKYGEHHKNVAEGKIDTKKLLTGLNSKNNVGMAAPPLPPSSGLEVGDPIPAGEVPNAKSTSNEQTVVSTLATPAGSGDVVNIWEKNGVAKAGAGDAADPSNEPAFGSGKNLAGQTGRDQTTFRDPRTGEVFDVKLEFAKRPKAGSGQVVARTDKLQPIMQTANDGTVGFRFKNSQKQLKPTN